MASAPTRLLLLEDDPQFARLLRALLDDAAPGEFVITLAERLADALTRIRTEQFDAVLSDLGLPDSSGLATVEAIVGCAPMLPLVVLTGLNDEKIGQAAIRHGAQDFLVKNESAGVQMTRTLRFAIERKRFEVGLRAANDALAGHVATRTAELEQANHTLQASAEKSRVVEEQLRKLAQAVEQSPVSIVITDRAGRIEYINRRFTEVTGYAREEAIGRNPRVLQSGQTPRESYDALWQNLSNGRDWRGTFRNRRKNGELFWEEASISPMVNERGEITHFVAVKEDITERKQFEQALIVARDAAEASARSKAAFLANMSHEIRTPMNGIMGLTELVLETELAPDQRENLELAYQSAQGLLRVINDVLDFSKIDAGKLELESLSLDLRETLDQILRTMASQAARKGLRLVLRLADDIPAGLLGDPERLRQVIVNLVDNAIKFTAAGEVIVGVVIEVADEAEVRLHFTVSDTGVGIPRDRLGAIFEAFTQVDSSITREFGGTGLGLAICRRLVELMNGRIWVESELGSGAQFHFIVTLARRTGSAQADQAQNAIHFGQTQGARKWRVLLAEDNPVNQKITLAVLAKAGHQVALARNGQEAVDLAKSAEFDAILMDLQMPVMDGFAATRAIRKRGISTPIIALTAHALKGLREECLGAGMDDYLTKPIPGRALLAKLAELQGCEFNANACWQRALMAADAIESALLDVEGALLQSNGDIGTVRAVAGMVATQIRVDLPELRRLSLGQSCVELRDAAHRLKGSLSSIGANAAHRACRELENLARESGVTEFTGSFMRLEAELLRVMPELIKLADQPIKVEAE